MRSVSIISKMTSVATNVETNTVTLSTPSIVKIKVDRADIASMQRSHQDLVITLKDGETVTVKNFYVTSDQGSSQLVLEGSDGTLWWVKDTDGAFHFQQISSIDELLVAEGNHEGGAALWPWLLGGAVVAGGIGIAAASGGGGGGGHHNDDGNSDPGTPKPPLDTTPPAAPTNLTITPDGKTVTGKAEPGSTVTIRDPNGNVIGTGKTDNNGNFTVDLNKPQSNGEHLTAEAKDPSNNTGPTAPITAPDTTPPNAPTNLAINAEGTMVTGKAEAGSTVKVTDSNGNVIGTGKADANGNFTVTLTTPQTDGEHLKVTATDNAGNQSPAATIVAPDSLGEAQNQLQSVVDDVGAIKGTVHSGQRTDDDRPTFSGKGKAGDTVTLYDNGAKIGSVVVAANGTWSFTPATPLKEGTHSVVATNENSPGSIPGFSFIVDTTAPAAPSGLTPSADGTQLSGKAEPGSTIIIKDADGNTIGTGTTGSNGTFTVTLSPAQITGEQLTATATDSAGNTSGEGKVLSPDRTPPDAPEDLIINANGNQITGEAEPGSTIIIKNAGGTQIGTGKTDASGHFTITLSPAQTDGEKLAVTATDAAGNISGPASVTAPDFANSSQPTIISVTDDVAPATGTVANGGQTNDTRPTLNGHSDAWATITVYEGKTVLGTAKADGKGNWSFTLTSSLSDGSHAFTAMATNTVGKESTLSGSYSVIIDTSLPDAPAIITVMDDVPNVTGAVQNGKSTNDTTPTISGSGEPGSTITIYNGVTVLGTAKADGAGNWSFTPPKALNDGVYVLHATATDGAGNVGAQSPTFTFTIDSKAPVAPSFTAVIDNTDGTNVVIGKGGATNDSTPTITGKSEAGATIIVYNTVNGTKVELGTTTADAQGNWTLEIKTPLTEGTYSLSATATDSAGNVSPLSPVQTFTLDLSPPAAPGGLAVSADGKTVTGTAEANSVVTIKDSNGVVLGTATADSTGHFSAALTPLQDNNQILSVTATDKAGNTSTPAGVKAPDLVAPDAPQNLHVSDNGATITGEAEPGSTVTIKDGQGVTLGSAEADANGDFSIPLVPAQVNGEELTAVATDKAGNQSAPADVTAPDITAPQMPVIGSVVDDVPEGIGALTNGQSTNDTKPTLNGTAEANATITIYDNNVFLGTTTANGLGVWTFTPDSALGTGGHSFTVTATDKTGNISDPSSPFAVVIDTTAPGMPTVTNLVDDQEPSVGFVTNGQSTNDTLPVINGAGEVGSTVSVFDGTKLLGTALVDASGTWSLTLTTPLGEGPHSLTLSAVDKAGNTTANPTEFTFTVDTTLPDAPVIIEVYDDVGPKIGLLKSGDTTDDTRPTFSGTAEPNTQVQIMDGQKVLGIADVDSTGHWSVTPVAALDEGTHNLTIITVDKAGNQGPTTDFTLTVDTQIPAVPAITAINDDVGSVKGNLVNNQVTDDTKPTLSGTGESGSTINVYDNGTLLGTATVVNGSWVFTPDNDLDKGPHAFTVTETNAAGNTSPFSPEFTINIDTDAPTKPVIGAVTDDVEAYTGPLTSGSTTNDNKPTLSGTGTEGDKITILDGTKVLGSVIVGEDGKWSFTPTDPLDETTHTLTITATDPAGNVSLPSDGFVLTVDITPPVAPELTDVQDNAGAINGSLSSGDRTDDNTPTLSGSGPMNSLITVLVDGKSVGTTTTDSLGAWSFTPSTPLGEGSHILTVTATDNAGNVSSPTADFEVVIDTTGPALPVISSITDDVGPIRTPLTDGSYTDDSLPTINGTAEANGKVIIYNNGIEIGRVDVDSLGNWSFTPDSTKPLADGNNVLTFQALDDLGNPGQISESITLHVDTKAPDAPTNLAVDLLGTTLTGQAEANSIITVRNSAGVTVGTATTDGLGNFTVTGLPIQLPGAEFSVTAQDKAGNISLPGTVDSAPTTGTPVPIIISITDNVGDIQGPLSNGSSTDDTQPLITGTAAIGSTVYVTIDGVESIPILALTGTWSYLPTPPLGEGTHTISARAELLGSASAQSTVISITVDLTPPAAASITSVTDDVGAITGPVANGGGTDDSTPTLRGIATGSANVEIFNGSTSIGTAAVNAQGNWTFTPSAPLANGIYNFTVVAIDAAGNRATGSNTWTVTIDNATPTPPVLGDVDDNVGTIIGPIPSNGKTDDTQPTLNGTAPTGSTVTVYDNGVPIGTVVVTASNGAWSFTPTTPLGEGSHSLTLTTTNTAGNTSAQSSPAFEFAVDTTAPARPILTSVTDDQTPSTGPLTSNQATNDTQPTFTGTAEAGSTVQIFDNGTKIGEVLVPASGVWSFTPDTPLSNATHPITINTVDAAGNVSASTAPFNVVVDTVAPNPPSAVTAIDGTAPTTGPIVENQRTNETRPVLSGSVEPNATVHILDNGTEIGTVQANASGNWSFTPGTALGEGNHQLTVTATDSAGNTSLPSPALNFVVDTTGPAAPVIVNASDDVGSITTPLVSGNVTDDTTPTLNGTSEAFATIRILDNGTQIGTAQADLNGIWTFTPTTPLGNGSHAFTTIATDQAGNTGATSPAFTLTVDTTPPAAPVILQAQDDVGSVQGTLLTTQSTDDTRPTLSGTGEVGATIRILDNGAFLGNASVGSDGTWTFTPTTDLLAGSHTFTATATDAAGNTGTASGNFVLNIDLSAPIAPVISGAVDDIGTIKGPLTNGQVTDDTRPTLSGTGEAGATITVYDNGTLLGTTTVNGSGSWTFTSTKDLTTGSHSLTATATDPVGNTGPASTAWVVVVDTTAPNAPLITTVADDVGNVKGNLALGQPTDDTTPTLSGTSEANAIIHIYDKGVDIGQTQADGGGNWSFTPTTPLTEGAHDLTVKATDAAGNTSAASAVTTVTVDLTPPAKPTDLAVNGTGNQVTGHAEANSTVTILSSTGTVLGTGVTDGLGNFTATISPAQTNGEALQAYATDVAGNQGQPESFNAQFSGLPGAPVIVSIYDDVGSIQGNVGNNQSTNDNQPAISGTAQARSTVNIYNNGTLLATVVASDTGAWSYTPTTALTEGLHAITATATNTNGTGSPSTAINITVDTIAPNAPTATVSSDGFSVSGTAEANSTVSVTVPGQATPITVTADGSGNWSAGLPVRLISGEQVSAIATDAAGNSSTPRVINAPVLEVAASDNVVNLELVTSATVTQEDHSDYGFLLVGALGNVASVLGNDTAQVTFSVAAGGSGSAVIEAAATGVVLSLLNSLEIAVQKYDTTLQAWVTVYDTSLPQFANLLTIGATGVRMTLDNLTGGDYRVLSFNTSLLAVGSYTSLDVSLVKTSAGTVTATAPETGNVITDSDPNSGTDVAPAGTVVTSIANASGTVTQVGAGGADILGKYGTLHIDQNGAYTYTLTNNTSAVLGRSESFVYTITQGTHSSSANLVITLGSTLPPSSVTAADDTATLQFDTTVAAVDNGTRDTSGFTLVGLGVGNVIDVGLLNNMQSPIIYNVDAGTTRTLSLGASVGGVAVGAVFDLYVYRYNAATQQYEQYRHQADWLEAVLLGGTTKTDYVITLPDGKYLFTLNAVSGLTVATGFTLSVHADHTYSVKTATASTTGDVLDNDAGAATGHVTEVNGIAVSATGTTTITGLYGTLTIDAQGHYTYTLKPGLGADSIKTPDSFVYTLTGANGDTSKASLNIQPTAKAVDAVNDTSTAMVLDTTQVSAASPTISAGSATIVAGKVDASSSADFDVAAGTALKSLSVTFSISQLTNVNLSVSSWAIYEGSTLIYQGTPIAKGQYTLANSRTLTLTGLELDAGHYTLQFNAHLSSAALLGSVTVTPTINATAYDLDNFLINNNTHTVTGNIYNGHDSAGAIDQVSSAMTQLTVSGNNSTQTLNPLTNSDAVATIQGHYGTLKIAIDGSYTYTLNSGLHPSDITTKETFTYTLNDQKGHSDSATLTIDMAPQFTSTSQADLIHGSAYADTLIYDLLNSADNSGGNAAVNKPDHWDNFSLAQGDKIDVSDLLVGWDGQQSSLGNYLSVTTTNGSTTISIDRDGTGTAHASTQLITLDNVQTTLNELLDQHHIVT
jgi:VCBS repeat/type 1 secretion C-terminal target domain (VC_A0849 subclass)